MPTFAVTGASGFIGRNLVRTLAADPENIIYAIVHHEKPEVSFIRNFENVRVLSCDMRDMEFLRRSLQDQRIQTFFHLAWEGSTGSLRADYALQMENVSRTADAFALAEELGCGKFLCAGTISENLIEQIGALEAVSQNMIYALAKKTAFHLLTVLAKNSHTRLVWMRFSNVYGPGNRSGNLISYTFEELRNNRTPQFGNGLQPYNFIYIDDLIKGICCLERAELRKNLYFIGTEEVKPLREFLMEIPAALGANLEIGLGRRPDDGLVYDPAWFDISDLKSETDFAPEYTFERGVRTSFELENREMSC